MTFTEKEQKIALNLEQMQHMFTQIKYVSCVFIRYIKLCVRITLSLCFPFTCCYL